jgi:hypothetical protein
LCLDPLEERTLLSAVVHPLFDLAAATTSPFPSNRFTVADTTQNTGRLVNLPLPNKVTNPSDYQDTVVLNTLDGFNLQPRLSIPFDGPIDVNSINSHDVFLVRMNDTLPGGSPIRQVVGINQVVWDPATDTLHVESDQLLDQHTRYALIVTDGVLNQAGKPVGTSEEFTSFLHNFNPDQAQDPALTAYHKDLLDAMKAARRIGVLEGEIAVASVFTTMSATAVLEKIRDQIDAETPAPADFLLGPNQTRTVFNLGQVTGITFDQQTKVNVQPKPGSGPSLELSLLNLYPGAVGQIAFGEYSSPDYEVSGEYIPPVATRTGVPVVQHDNEIYFNLFLPSGPEPAGGWPVAIFGHGVTSNKNVAPLSVAATMAEHGIATIAINAAYFGYGPLSTLTVNLNQAGAAPVTFSAGGRSIDQNGDNTIGASEGQAAAPPQTIIYTRDSQRQTVADLMQLVREIEVGMDVNGDGNPDLDPSRISYVGQSLGGWYGTDFLAVEPDVSTGVLVVPGGSVVELGRLGSFRSTPGNYLLARTPQLLNSPGVTKIDGLTVGGPYFNEDMPLRDGVPMTVTLADNTTQVIQSPVTDPVPGAMAIQEAFENLEWVSQASNPVAYAPHLRKDHLPGVPAKSVLFQFAKGDQSAPNPTNTAIIRAGGLANRTTFYLHDLARAENPGLPSNPHGFLTASTGGGQLVFGAIALGAQRQIATFFASNGRVIDKLTDITTKDGKHLFEVPIALPLPEGLNYPGSAKAGAQILASESQVSSPTSTDAAGDELMVEPLTGSAVTTAARAGIPMAPTAPLIDRALDALPPLARFAYALDIDDLAAGFLRPARRRR